MRRFATPFPHHFSFPILPNRLFAGVSRRRVRSAAADNPNSVNGAPAFQAVGCEFDPRLPLHPFLGIINGASQIPVEPELDFSLNSSKPRQRITGTCGYFGYAGSERPRVHMVNKELRSLRISRRYRHSLHNPWFTKSPLAPYVRPIGYLNDSP